MEASISHGTVRRSRDSDITTSGTSKRRRFGCQDEDNDFQLQYRSQRDADVNFRENIASTAVSGTFDNHVNSPFTCSVNHESISDLKDECLSETEMLMSVNDGFRRDTSESSVVSVEPEEIESVSTSLTATAVANEATSRLTSPTSVAKMPSAAEIEEFFSKAEEYEQKRFAEKYNYDIMKDVPIEGRYLWIRVKTLISHK